MADETPETNEPETTEPDAPEATEPEAAEPEAAEPEAGAELLVDVPRVLRVREGSLEGSASLRGLAAIEVNLADADQGLADRMRPEVLEGGNRRLERIHRLVETA